MTRTTSAARSQSSWPSCRDASVVSSVGAAYPLRMRPVVLPSRSSGALSILGGVGLLLVSTRASADVPLAPMVEIDLSGFDGSGFAPDPAPGQLDSDDWSVRLSDISVLDFGGAG
ncbi:MAG: hypothetical protein K1X88_20510, partial [Nannocystaceae bacterium]|nr:hypothetical protein [Nannocystaceae bacterium]